MHILYLHGFRSAPASSKASMMADEMRRRGLADKWTCPQLPASPQAAAELIRGLATEILARSATVNASDALTVVGSSLGGYYATWLAQRLECRAILLNPCVNAARDLGTQIGSHRQYHTDEPFIFLPEYVDALRALWVDPLTRPERYFLIAAKGDELLDWREMANRYRGSTQHILEGGDHALSDFETLLPLVMAFAGEGKHTD